MYLAENRIGNEGVAAIAKALGLNTVITSISLCSQVKDKSEFRAGVGARTLDAESLDAVR